MTFSVNVILQLHAMLLRYMPNEGGRWKMTDNDIVERNSDGTIKPSSPRSFVMATAKCTWPTPPLV